MGKKTTPAPTDGADEEKDPALASTSGRTWLKAELAREEATLRTGPGGSGWTYNEALRPAVEERIAFLKALLDLQLAYS